MTSRERVYLALEHRQPDRVPIDIGGTYLTGVDEIVQQRLIEALGIKGERNPRFKYCDNRIQEFFGSDLRGVRPNQWPDWGFDWNDLSVNPMRHFTSITEVEQYPWPDPNPEMVAGLRDEAKFLHEETDYFICASHIGNGIFELGCYLRGYDQFMLDIAMDPDFVYGFNRKALEVNRRFNDLFYSEVGPYVDMVLNVDDLGTQNAPFISPETFAALFKPFLKEFIDSIKSYCPQAYIGHHSCGSIFRLMDHLRETGIQILNPVQTTAAEMSLDYLKTKKKMLSFFGGLDQQQVLPFGTVEETKDYVRRIVSILGEGGGYIFAGSHILGPDARTENIIAAFKTAVECR